MASQKLAKEVYDLKQITQSLMSTINKLINEQNPKQQLNQQVSSQEMQRQVNQIKWIQDKIFTKNKSTGTNQVINDLFQNQEEYRIRHLPIRKLKKDADFVKNMAIRQINSIDLRVNNSKKQREEFKIYLKFIAHQTQFYIRKNDFNLTKKLQRLQMHQDDMRVDKQDLSFKNQQKDRISNILGSMTLKTRLI